MRISALLIISLSLLFITGCRTTMVVPAPAPVYLYPPLAPAPGYRYHYHNHDLRYDNGLGAYVVLGYNDIYFYNRLYLRFVAGEWEVTDRLNHTWRRADARDIPDRLRHHKRFKRYRKPPPPHAPAHGYRYHYQDHDLKYDSRIGAYIVLGINGIYFLNNRYMRYYDGYWHYSDRPNGTWHRARDRDIPERLRTYQRQRFEQDHRRRNSNGLINNIRRQQLQKDEQREERRRPGIQQERHEEGREGRREIRHERPVINQQNQRQVPLERKPTGQRGPTKPGLYKELKEKRQHEQSRKKKAKKKTKNKHDKSKKNRDKKRDDKDNNPDDNRDANQ